MAALKPLLHELAADLAAQHCEARSRAHGLVQPFWGSRHPPGVNRLLRGLWSIVFRDRTKPELANEITVLAKLGLNAPDAEDCRMRCMRLIAVHGAVHDARCCRLDSHCQTSERDKSLLAKLGSRDCKHLEHCRRSLEQLQASEYECACLPQPANRK